LAAACKSQCRRRQRHDHCGSFQRLVNQYTLGDQYALIYYEIDGGDGNDRIEVLGSSSTWSGQSSFLILGGAGNDTITLRDTNAGRRDSWSASYGISEATLDGGDGDDILIASGVLNLTLTGGSGRDTFVLNAAQYRTLRQGDRQFYTGQQEEITITEDIRRLLLGLYLQRGNWSEWDESC
jgi:Ca2+-binding RTX toxin-like protein